MTLLEKQAVQMGYHYIYLWTQTAIAFYQKLEYKETHRVSLHRPCLKMLKQEQVSQLELLLSKRVLQVGGTNNGAGSSQRRIQETILLPPTDDATKSQEEDVWLRKRLVESLGCIEVPMERRLEEINEALHKLDNSSFQWRYQLVRIPWQQQVGPSCGLAALRMLRDHYHAEEEDVQRPSLLAEAQAKGFSDDGEVFDATNLSKLGESCCGLDCKLVSFAGTTVDELCSLLSSGGVYILPYDSIPVTRLPGYALGRYAHYGIIVGVLLGYKHDNDFSKTLEERPDHSAARPVTQATHTLLLVQHSLSRDLCIVSHGEFLASNQQLTSINPEKFRATNINLADRLVRVKG
jgi:hypothetical protein